MVILLNIHEVIEPIFSFPDADIRLTKKLKKKIQVIINIAKKKLWSQTLLPSRRSYTSLQMSSHFFTKDTHKNQSKDYMSNRCLVVV